MILLQDISHRNIKVKHPKDNLKGGEINKIRLFSSRYLRI